MHVGFNSVWYKFQKTRQQDSEENFKINLKTGPQASEKLKKKQSENSTAGFKKFLSPPKTVRKHSDLGKTVNEKQGV